MLLVSHCIDFRVLGTLHLSEARTLSLPFNFFFFLRSSSFDHVTPLFQTLV